MKAWIGCLACVCTGWISADSVYLLNDSSFTLRATLYDAQGTMMGEFVLKPQDASSWNNDNGDFGSEMNSAYQVPYSVQWSCLGGTSYGLCDNVASGATVTAQSCGGAQECSTGGNAEESEEGGS